MAIYHIVLIPEKKQRDRLNNLKNKLYAWWYRYTSRGNSHDVHISLNEIYFDDMWLITTIKEKLSKIAKRYKPFTLPYLEITDKIYKQTNNKELNEKYPNGRWWVSILFNNKDNELWFLAEELITMAKLLHIDDMASYIDKIKSLKNKDEQSNNILDYTANHMNICNYALPEKASEAKAIIEKYIPKEITFDTLALRNLDWKNEFEVKIKN